MGVYLGVAYKVLKEQGTPLTAREIVSKAQQRGLLETSGRTPWQTMKSKLSTNILQKREQSVFMRTAAGRFGLREWKSIYPEHIAERYQKALFDEDIVVIPVAGLTDLVPGPGLYKGDFDRQLLLNYIRPMRRREAEEDFSVIQLVSVFVIKFRSRLLTYKRTKRLPEGRLHGFYSLAFGGHLNPDDVTPLFNVFEPTSPFLTRELKEELRVRDSEIANISFAGLLYDDSRPVSRQHLGITYNVELGTERIEIGERGFLTDAKFETVDDILARLSDFENWSVILIREEQ